MSSRAQQTICEVIWGKVIKQSVYASKQRDSKANTTTQRNSLYANEYSVTLRDGVNNVQIVA